MTCNRFNFDSDVSKTGCLLVPSDLDERVSKIVQLVVREYLVRPILRDDLEDVLIQKAVTTGPAESRERRVRAAGPGIKRVATVNFTIPSDVLLREFRL